MPQNSDAVVITNSYVLTLTADVATTGLSVTVQRGGVLDLVTYKFTNTLNQLAGQGTLRIQQAYFPTVTTNNFADAGTGTVEYYNWASTTAVLPTGTAKYNNLRLLNSTSTAYTAQLDADLLLNGNLTLVSTGSGAVTLNLGATVSKNRALTVQGNISVGSGTTLGVTAVAGAHTLSVGGSFTNQGTVNLHNGTADDTQVALLLFTGANNASFACNGPTNLGRLQIDKGTDSQNMLDVTSTSSSSSNGNLHLSYVGNGRILILVNGVARFGNNIFLEKIHNGTASTAPSTDPANPNSSGWWELGSSATSPTLWIDGAKVVNDNAVAFIVYGTYRISKGVLSTMTPDAMVVREDGQVLIEGGTTSVNKYRPSSTSASHRGSFTMTGGVFQSLGTIPFSSNDNFARFSVPYLTQSFRMSGGTLQVQNPAATDGSYSNGLFHVGVNPNNAIVSGGTIELTLPSSSTTSANVNGNILSTAPLWNLTIKKAGTTGSSKAVLANVGVPSSYTSGATTTAQPLTVLNNLTVDGTNPTTFDAANLNVTIQGSFVVAQGSTYLPGTNTTYFSGGQNQTVTNNGAIGTANNAFNNLTMDKSAGTLTLGGSNSSYTVSGTLSLLNGVLSDGGKTLYAVGNVVNSATHTSDGGSGSITLSGSINQTISGNGNGIFGNLTISSSVAAGSVAATCTANMTVASSLTFGSSNLLAIGANRLSLTNVDVSSAITSINGFGTQCFVQTAGNQSDLGLQKTYGGADNFTFPVGTGTKYAPATVQLSLATGLAKYGQVSVSPVAAKSPFVTSANALAYYWKVRSTGFGAIPTNAINMSFKMTNTDATGTLANYVPARYLPTAWTTYSSPSQVQTGNPSSLINVKSLSQFEGEFTAGQTDAFGTVVAYYTRVTSGNWATASTWSTAGFNGAAASTIPASNNPVFIGSASAGLYHTVTVAANGANSGSLVIDRGSTMDVGVTTGHNFGALPDAKVGGSGRLRVSTNTASVTFPGGDFGSFIQQNGGTVEYYTTGTQNFTLPTASGTLTLNQYRNLWVNAGSSCTITMPTQDLRVYAQLKTGVANGSATFPGTVLLSTGSTGNLRADSLLAVQAGTLSYANTTARTLTADTDVRVDVGATFNVTSTNAAVANALSVGRSLTNNGILDFFNSTTTTANNTTTTTVRKVDLAFINAQNGSFTGTNSSTANGSYTGAYTDLATMTVNKGQGQASVLTLDVAGTLSTPTNTWLTLTNGTLRYAKTTGTLTIHDAASPYLIPATAGLTLDAVGATATVATGGGATTDTTTPTNNTSSPSDLRLGGQLQVLQGTLNVGASGNLGNDLEYASAGAPGIRIGAAGTLYVNGQIRRTTANTDGALRYDQMGGTVNIDGVRATVYQNNERGLFEVQGKGSIFRMSGGTLNLRGSNSRPTIIADLYVRPDSTVVTSGLVQLGSSAASALTVSVESLVPLWDMKVINGPSNGINTGMLTGVNPLRLQGSLTIDGDYAVFNANGLGLSIDQLLYNNNSSTSTTLNSGGFWPGTTAQTTTFTGLGPALQKLTTAISGNNLTTFGSLTLNNAQTGGTLQLDRDARVAGTLTLTKGTLADNGRTLTVLGNVVNSATHTSASGGSLVLGGSTNQTVDGNDKGRFGNLTLSNAAGATTLANHEITGVLSFTSGVLTISSNLLWLSNPAAGAVTGASTTSFVRTNGIVADLGLRKSFPAAAQDFTFPVGAAAKYTPVRMNITANSAVGQLTVKPVDLAHPSNTDPANALTYYWKVSSTGFQNPTVSQVFSYIDNGAGNDVNGTEASYKLGRFLNGAWTPVGGIAASTVDVNNNTISQTGASAFEGDYTAGATSAFGVVPVYYSRTSTAGRSGGANWNDASAWTSNSDGSDSTPLPTTAPTTANPVTILASHLINSSGAGRGAASLKLLGTLDLSSYGANNFNVVTGTGTVKIGSALFPAGNYATFVDTNGGTVEYTSANQLPARDTYNNLTLSGGNAKLLSNLDLTVNGALTVAASTTVSNPTNQAISLTSSTLGMSVGGTFNLGDGPLSTTAGLATVSGGTLNLGAGLLSIGTTLANGGTLNNGSADVQVGTAFSNTGTYNANANTGNLVVGTTFSNSGTYSAGSGRLLVSGNLTNESTGSFTNATGDVTTQGNFSNYGTYGNTDGTAHTLRVSGNFVNQTVTTQRLAGTSAGSFAAAGTSTLVLYGDFTNLASFDAGNSLVQFIHDNPHSIKGATTFYDVRKQGAGTTGLASNISIGDVLTMQSGLLATNGNTLTMLNSSVQPVVGTSTSSYIAGRLAMNLPTAASTRVFPVGLGGRYRPVTLRPASTSANSGTPQAVVEIINSAPAGSLDNTLSNMSANRYYRVQMLNGTATNPTVQLSFNTDVVDEEVHVPGNLRVARSSGNSGPWSTASGAGVFSPGDPRGYTTSAPTTVDGTSFFALASTNKVDNPLTGSAPLPVQLVRFVAARQGSQVRLDWTTASELHSSYFVVQRSADGQVFADGQRVAAQGSSAVQHDYLAFDAAPLPGLSYYRLKQVDTDGTFAYSAVATVRFDEAGTSATPALVAYPNPSAASQGFRLQTSNLATTGGTVRLFDAVGRQVLTQTVAAGTAEAAIQPAQLLPTGVYYATWQATDGPRLSVKVVVE